MADRSEGTEKITVGQVQDVSGDVNIAGGDIYAGYSAEQVSLLLKQITTEYRPIPFDGRCPYKGLDAFEEDDAEFFFGREKLVEDLIRRISNSRTLFVTGASGSGKSSLVRAGLVPALKRGAIQAQHSEQWLYATIRPGRDPLEALALGFSRLKSPQLADYFRQNIDKDSTLNVCAESVLSERQDQRFVLFIDQFEEIFTQVSKDKAASFIALLACAATLAGGRVILVFAMRSDFISNCGVYPQLNEMLNQQFIQVGAMQPEELVSAIAQPALRVGLRIDPDLIAQIINDMKGEPGALPLMQFALKDLFDAEQAQGGVVALTREAYLERGGIHKALERHADEAFSQLSAAEQALAHTIFGGLIEVGRGTQDTRRTALLDELTPANVSPQDMESIIGKLAAARLITTDEQGGKDIVTISHEKLIDAWPWLRKLVNENRDAIALQNEIASDAREWDEHQRDASYLYTGARLASVNEQARANRIAMSGLANEFVQAGRARQRRGQQLIIAAVSGVVLLSIVAASVFASQARQNAQTAQTAQAASTFSIAQQMTAQAASTFAVAQQGTAESQAKVSLARLLAAEAGQALAEDAADTSQLRAVLAIESLRRFPTIQADTALRSLGDFWVRPSSGHPSDEYAQESAISPDGKRIALYGMSGISIRETESGAEIGNIASDMLISRMRFSPDGKWISAWGVGGGVWDAATGRQTVTISQDTYVAALAFSANSEQIAIVTDGGSVNIVETATGKQVASLNVGSSVKDAVLSPDIQRIAWDGDDGVIKIWNLAKASQVVVLASQDPAQPSAFSPDGKRFVSITGGATNAFVRLWDTATWKLIKGEPVDLQRLAVEVRPSTLFSPDSQRIVSQLSGNTLLEWDATSGEEIARLQIDLGVGLESMSISGDGKWLAASDFEGMVHIWDLVGHTERSRVALPGGATPNVESILFAPDGKWITTIDNNTGNSSTWLWNTDDLIRSACENFVIRNLYLREWEQYLSTELYQATCGNLPPQPDATSTLSGMETMEAASEATQAARATPTP